VLVVVERRRSTTTSTKGWDHSAAAL